MATDSERVSRWARGFVATGVCWLVVWQVAVLAGLPRRVELPLALYGFVFHVLFGKAYTLVPSYFDRDLAVPRAPGLHLPLAVAGTAGLALAPLDGVSPLVGTGGALSWALGVGLFLVTMLATLGTNLSGSETGTGDHNAHRRQVDRAANLFVPVVLAYLAVGSYGTLAAATGLPPLLDGYLPRTSHLLAAGTAALLVFAVGFRLLPRFLVAEPPKPLVAVVLPAGALGPALLALGLTDETLLLAGAVVEAGAVVGFALTYGWLFARSDRRRVGFYGVLAGVAGGVLAVGFGLWFALVGQRADLVVAHYRLTLLGFLGLTIVGVTYQFYPPAVAQFPGGGDRTAFASILTLGGGLLLQVAGFVAGASPMVTAGEAITVVGALAYAGLLLGIFVQRARR